MEDVTHVAHAHDNILPVEASRTSVPCAGVCKVNKRALTFSNAN
jgi:hypothetical protein